MASGVMGDPTKASAAKGKRIFEATVFALVSALVEMGK